MVAALLDAGVTFKRENIIPGVPGLPGPGFTALHDAVKGNREAIVKLLIDRKADVNARDQTGVTPLHTAARWSSPQVVKLLLDAKADVSAKDKAGRTPLLEAVSSGNADIVKLLIQAKADVHAKDDNGTASIHLAATYANTRVLKLLLDAGADVNAKDNRVITPLHFLALRSPSGRGPYDSDEFEQTLEEDRQDILAIARILIEAKANVNARDNIGTTPLHMAVERNGFELAITKFLLAQGADVNARDEDGKTPLALVGSYNKKMIGLIAKHGGER